MALEKQARVLVVGAGPVGMMTALLLAERGVRSTVIDEESGPAVRSYACALHPHTLELFEELDLIDELLPLGRRIESVAFYDLAAKRAEVRLGALPLKFPFLLVLPQSALEGVLEDTLKRHAGISVHWNHRLSDLQAGESGVTAKVDILTGTALGYIVPRWETVVKRTSEIHAEFLIGADGHASVVRQRLGIGYTQANEPELFSVFEFETDTKLPDEGRVVLEGSNTSVLWPLPQGRCRWSFQVEGKPSHPAFPDKERRAFWIEDPNMNEQLEQRLCHFIQTRAPWFAAKVRSLTWVSHVQFGRLMVKNFGSGRCWLVGDAAHQTGPAGVQSLNVGLRESAELAEVIGAGLEGGSLVNDLQRWGRRWQQRWKRLLGLNRPIKVYKETGIWVQQHAGGILPCLPGSGNELVRCAKQIHLGFH